MAPAAARPSAPPRLRTALPAALLLLLLTVSAGRAAPPESQDIISLLRQLAPLFRGREHVKYAKRDATEAADEWLKFSEPVNCSDMVADASDSDPEYDSDGAPLDAADYQNAMVAQLRDDSLPVDEPRFDDELVADDIVWPCHNPPSDEEDVPNNAIISPDERWPGGIIPYTIASGFSSSDRAAIAAGLLQLESTTCIRLRPRNSGDDNYVRIVRGSGCYSSVGRQRSGGQELSLGSGCLYAGIVAHEFMHAVGFWHEQSRPDRDQYVRIHYDNIRTGTEHNFKTYGYDTVQTLSVPYDIGSIMHYGPYAFARDRSRPTITALTTSTAEMGQRHKLSSIDIKKVNLLYECAGSGSGGGGGTGGGGGGTGGGTGGGGTGGGTGGGGGGGGSQCSDKNIHCEAWASAGECDANPQYMHEYCAVSCCTCSDENSGKYCKEWAADGECEKNPGYMHLYCRAECGLCTGGGKPAPPDCTDDNEHCQVWAETGECEVNPDYMLLSCRKACKKCS